MARYEKPTREKEGSAKKKKCERGTKKRGNGERLLIAR